MARRPYDLGKRAVGAARTRHRIIESARKLFLRGDPSQISLDAVAQAASVGRTTLFAQFGSRPGLLLAVEAEVSRRAGVEELLVALSTDDALEALEAAFVMGARVWAAERVMFRKLFSLSGVDVDLAQVMAEKDAGRRALCRQLAQRLARQGYLKKGTSERTATEVLALLTSFDSFDAVAAKDDSAGPAATLLLDLAKSRLLTRR